MKKFLVTMTLLSIVTVSAAETPAKTSLCAACHGQGGISTNPEWPSLAGQHAHYLIKQLQDFKKGVTRNAATMTPLSAALTENEINELAKYYANQSPPKGTTPKKDLKRGELLYREGDLSKHITACIACHGPKGTGNEQADFPMLSGQNALYTVQQLHAFKEHQRSNDLNSIMRTISAPMNEEDMNAVAYYIQGLH